MFMASPATRRDLDNGDAAHGNNRNLARAAANIHNHVCPQALCRQIRAHGRGHRLLGSGAHRARRQALRHQ